MGEEGLFLGSEEDIQDRLGVSRPTLRQAARILEHENVLEVRRGPRGGLYSRAPTADAVSHVASVYLRHGGTTHRELHQATAIVVPEIARLAASNPSADARAALARYAHDPGRVAGVGTPDLTRRAVHDFGLHLIALVDNRPIVLFYEMLLDLTVSLFPAPALDAPKRGRRVMQFHGEAADAIEVGDGARAAEVTVEYFRETARWLDADERKLRSRS